MSDTTADYEVLRLDEGGLSTRVEEVAHEEPLELQLDGVPFAVLMRTPGHDEDLARGFLLTERIIERLEDVVSVRHCTTAPDPEADGNVVRVRLRDGVRVDLEQLRRNTFASSSCGVCGKATIASACGLAAPLEADRSSPDPMTMRRDALLGAPDLLYTAQAGFAKTGGVHAAGLFTRAGELVLAREDVGRHNAVDKALGKAAASGIDFTQVALVVSGRVSFELVQKAAAVRIPILAGISAPTSLAVRAARALRMTLIGFLRGATMNVYAGEERLET
ncbi:MAG: formate dehydrogenase accessory sulfurtransferase FdhD [Deltaproteobacteria bacterium]|nr:formate dehydrogenase accessory sulfurtransferase FdhD [Deltaproteobacteria bacterium]